MIMTKNHGIEFGPNMILELQDEGNSKAYCWYHYAVTTNKPHLSFFFFLFHFYNKDVERPLVGS